MSVTRSKARRAQSASKAEGPDYRDLAKWFKDTHAGMLDRTWPMEDVTCGRCGSEGCLMYPGRVGDEKMPQPFQPTVICFQCSDVASEDFLRWQAQQAGYILKSVGLFTHSWTPEWCAGRDAWFAEQARLMALAGIPEGQIP